MPCGAREDAALPWPAASIHAQIAREPSPPRILQGTGVGLAAAQAEFRQYVKNLPALDFHLAREIVDTNLTHPPLFKMCCPKPLVAHSYLVAMAVLENSDCRPIGFEGRRILCAVLFVRLFVRCCAFCFVQFSVQRVPSIRGGNAFHRQVLPRRDLGLRAGLRLSASSRTTAAFSASASASPSTAGAFSISASPDSSTAVH